MTLPAVSCFCSTYNRAPNYLHLLEEAIHSFLVQDYDGEKELVVLNDTPGQEVAFDFPGVRIVNCPQRYHSLGMKWNELVRYTTSEILLPWDDDDISLPGRIRQAVERLTERRADHFNPRHVWYMDGNGLHHEHAQGYCHHAAAFTKELLWRVGGYAEDPKHSGANDALIDPKLHAAGWNAPPLRRDAPETWTYIYRFGVSNAHASAPAIDRGHEKYDWIGSLPVTQGRFELHPRWRQDYVKLVRDKLVYSINRREQ